MSIVLTRLPLESIGMNGAGIQKRRSARLSGEGNGENEPPSKKAKTSAATTTVNTKQQDGGSIAAGGKKKKVYEEEVEGFSFSKGRRKKALSKAAVEHSVIDAAPATHHAPAPAPAEQPAPKTVEKKTRRKLPTTPEREAPKSTRRSKRVSNEPAEDSAPAQTTSKRQTTRAPRSPSPVVAARPVTVEKKRGEAASGAAEDKVMRIALPFADTPIIRKNREMRKNSAEGHRRSSSGMRGRRASSLIDEGRGNALPHAEVPTSEFYKHISADLTEPRRMRCLLGWCGQRALPPKPEAPLENTASATLDFRARQAARIVQEELSADLVGKASLSNWFSRDDVDPPPMPVRRKPNPRNIANAAKAEELARELEKLVKERAEWDAVVASAVASSPPPAAAPPAERAGFLSPVRADLLDSPQREILAQLQPPSSAEPAVDASSIQQRLRGISADLEFAVDQFAHGVHALRVTRDTAERVADASLARAARVLDERAEQRAKASGSARVDQMDALRGLARVLNTKYR